jgi:hypothetical protein
MWAEQVFFPTNNNLLILGFSREKKKSYSCLDSNENQIKPKLLVSQSIYLSLFSLPKTKSPETTIVQTPTQNPTNKYSSNPSKSKFRLGGLVLEGNMVHQE